jgi:hypothetical protein
MRNRCSVFVLAMTLAIAACGGKGKDDGAKGGGEAGLASCNSPKFSECKQYNQANRALGDDMLKKLCVNFEGTYATVGCATADRVGVQDRAPTCSGPPDAAGRSRGDVREHRRRLAEAVSGRATRR